MLPFPLYMAQRLSALVMGPFVLGHVAVMIYAIQGGLSAAEILGRTQGSILWFLFYATFACAVAVHAAIGLRVVMAETFGWGGRGLDLFMWGMGLLLGLLGLQAVCAVTWP